MFGPRKDIDKRWNEFPDVTVTIEGGCDISSDDQTWNWKATRKDGAFMIGTNYTRLDSARLGCYRALLRNVAWKKPSAQPIRPTRAQVFGAIGEPDGALAKYLANWTAENT